MDIQEMDITGCGREGRIGGGTGRCGTLCTSYRSGCKWRITWKSAVRSMRTAQNIANVCKKSDCKMVYISTDYVFDGEGTRPRARGRASSAECIRTDQIRRRTGSTEYTGEDECKNLRYSESTARTSSRPC